MGRPGNQVGTQDPNQGWSVRCAKVQGSFVVINGVEHYERMLRCDKVRGSRVSLHTKAFGSYERNVSQGAP